MSFIRRRNGTVPKWTQSLGVPADTPLDNAARVELIERLMLLGLPWCESVLRQAAGEENDVHVSRAIDGALSLLSRP